ncbi:MAG: HEAT repeat domain-containing protein [Planctomycetota bacterium]|nr:HEAT repeat domain-containing protein [Planctomycetota bacterium]
MKYPILTAGVLLAGLLATAGCEPKPGDAAQPHWWNAPSEADLVKMANDPSDPDQRRQGINGLGKLSWGGAGRHAGLFVERLGDEDNNVRSAAIRALAQLGQAQYVPALVAKLEDPSLMVRDDAAVALDTVQGEQAVAPLQAHASGDPNPQVRGRCARALRHYSGREVLNTLVGCLKDNNFGVRYEAHESLKSLTNRDFEYDAARWGDYVSGANVPAAGARADKGFLGLLGSGESKATPPPAPPVPPAPPADSADTGVLPPPPNLDYPVAPARPDPRGTCWASPCPRAPPRRPIRPPPPAPLGKSLTGVPTGTGWA